MRVVRHPVMRLSRVNRGRDTEAKEQADLTRDADCKTELFRRDRIPTGSLDRRGDAPLTP